MDVDPGIAYLNFTRLEEAPNQFIDNSSISLLLRPNLPEEIYVQVLSQQLKRPAATWWQNLKGLI